MPESGDKSGILLALSGASKVFGGAQALDDINISFEYGKVHSLVGENGAGKSTLGKILLGDYRPSSGQILYKGEEINLRSPAEANNLGLVGIAQELSLMPNRTVADNISLGREVMRGPFVDRKKTLASVLAVMDRYDMHLDPEVLVGSLPVAEQQKVEILRALSRDTELIVFDEPTARLASHEAEKLRDLVKNLAQSGKAIVYISHFLDEVLEVSDTITVLRNGKLVRTSEADTESRNSLVEGVTGESNLNQFPVLPKADLGAPPVLSVTGLSHKGLFEDISLDIRPGEILGLSGLVGAGRSELAHAIYGAIPAEQGEISFLGKDLGKATIADRLERGMGLIPESRRDQGLMMGRPILENVTLPYLNRFSGVFGLNSAKERNEAEHRCNETSLKHGGLEQYVDTLSGGNQQKVLFARSAIGQPTLLIADEPTRGVDIGAKRGIYDLIVALAEQGRAILLISSEIEEIMGLCHRVIVMSRGRIAAELSGNALTERAVMKAAFMGN